jgi:HTH-type transcriptional regulator/antitoxin HigA
VPATAERLPAKYLVKQEAPKTISSREQHQVYVSRLLDLQRKAHRTPEETETAKLLVVLIADYEAKHVAIESASGVDVLKELMESNGLRQKDLAEDVGGESIVSLILRGKRQLNRPQMERLGQRFHVSPAVFFLGTVAQTARKRSPDGRNTSNTRPRQSKIGSLPATAFGQIWRFLSMPVITENSGRTPEPRSTN